MYPSTMVSKCVEARKTFVAELADDGCGINGLPGLLQTSGLCNAAVVIMLRQTLLCQVFMLAYRYMLPARHAPSIFGFDFVARYILPEAATIASVEPMLCSGRYLREELGVKKRSKLQIGSV